MVRKIIGIIPARMASSRFPGKPLVDIHDVAMVGHCWYRSKMCDLLDEIYIATCDKEIMDYAESIGAKAIMTSDTHKRATDRTAEALIIVEEQCRQRVDIVVMIQGDEPMIHPQMIDDVVKPLQSDPSVMVSNLMAPMKSKAEHEDPNEVKVVVDCNSDAMFFSREPIPSRKKGIDDIPMQKQVCIIPFQRDFLMKFNELAPTPLEIIESVDMLRAMEHGYKVRMISTSFDTYSVDTHDDLDNVLSRMSDDKLRLSYTR